ncbi:LysR family transcriptional regulator [Kozakia baliensis]|nr:LysR family transcriptional regulator [Kozakia baliensis]
MNVLSSAFATRSHDAPHKTPEPPMSRAPAMSGQAPLLNRLKLRHLRLILELEATNNLHRAAERMNLSQPSISKLLQEVEHALHVPLFERSSQGVFPTAFGALAARHARLMLNDLTRLQRDMDSMRTGTYGTVRIGSIVAALPELVSPVLAHIADTTPGLNVSLSVDTSDALLLALEAGRIDFMIGRTLGIHRPMTLSCTELAQEPLCVVAGQKNTIEDNGNLTLKDIAQERWILQTAPSPMRHAIEAAFTLAYLPFPPHPVEASSMFATIDLLQHSKMLAVIPCSVSRNYEDKGILRRLSVPIPSLLGSYSAITAQERPLTPASSFIYDLILSEAIKKSDRLVQTCS